jgi:putative SbcD/Mre11-related phosphoesterase
MDHSRYQVASGIWLDARRALWLTESRTLAIADLHLGYAWAHRHAGQMLPINVPNDTQERLLALLHEYQPEHIIVVGDIVHRAIAAAPIAKELCDLVDCCRGATKLTLVIGNHDRHIGGLLEGKPAEFVTHVHTGGCVFLHGDAGSAAATKEVIESARRENQWIVMGHEHPSATLGDGVATWQKYPCFLICDGLIVLPAFSRWAAGNSGDDYMSPLLECTEVKMKVAILGNRLVPVSQ